MSNEPKLLPCPFCGSTSIGVHEGSTFRWRVVICDDCSAQSGEVRIQTSGNGTEDEWEARAKEAAMDEWNTRAEDAKTKAMREAIMQVLDDNGKDGHGCCEFAKQMAMRSVNAHYCPDWDFMPICPEDPEWDMCTCGVKK